MAVLDKHPKRQHVFGTTARAAHQGIQQAGKSKDSLESGCSRGVQGFAHNFRSGFHR